MRNIVLQTLRICFRIVIKLKVQMYIYIIRNKNGGIFVPYYVSFPLPKCSFFVAVVQSSYKNRVQRALTKVSCIFGDEVHSQLICVLSGYKLFSFLSYSHILVIVRAGKLLEERG